MSNTIDSRIVEMKFDNKDFEKNIKVSQETLEKFDRSLQMKGSTKGLENIASAAKGMDFNPLVAGINGVNSALRELDKPLAWVKRGFYEAFGFDILNSVKEMTKSLAFGQISAGYQKYNDKMANVQTIMNATGKSIDEVNSYLDDLMWYSDETSYSFSEMSAALSGMISSGGDIDTLIPTIEGIANSVSYAGKGAREFSSVIYNLQQSYSKGYIDHTDWRSVELMGANSVQLKKYLIEAAEEVGNIKKGMYELKDFGGLMTDKVFDTKVMEKAFGRFAEYTEAIKEAVNSGLYETATEAMSDMATDGFDEVAVKAFEASQQAKSFQEAVDATKDAVSSGWLDTFQYIFGDLDEATETWTELCNDLWEIFASSGERRNDILEEAMISPFDALKKKVEDTGLSFETFQEQMTKTGTKLGYHIDDLIEKYGSWEGIIKSGELKSTTLGYIIKSTFSDIVDTFTKVDEATTTTVDNLNDLVAVAKRVWRGDFGNGQERYEKLTAAGYEYAKVQGIVNKLVAGEEVVLEDLSEAELKNLGLTDEQIENFKELAAEAEKTGTSINDLIMGMDQMSGREYVTHGVGNILKMIIAVKDTIREAFDQVFTGDRVALVKNIAKKFYEFTGKLEITEDRADKLTRTFKGVFSVFSMAGTVVKQLINNVKNLIGPLPKLNFNLLDILATTGDALVSANEWVKQNDIIAKGLEHIIPFINNVNKKATEIFNSIKNNEKVVGIVNKLNTVSTDLMDKLTTKFPKVGEILSKITKFFKGLKEKGITASLKDIGDVFKNLTTEAEDLEVVCASVGTPMSNIFSTMSNPDAAVNIQNVGSGLVKVKDVIGQIVTTVKDFFGNTINWDTILGLGTAVASVVSLNKVSKSISGLGSSLKEIVNVLASKDIIGFKTIGNGIKNIGDGIKSISTAIQKQNTWKIILSFAGALIVLVGALAAISYLPQERLWSSVAVIGALCSMLVLSVAALAGVQKFLGGLSAFDVLGVVAIAGSVVILAGALAIIQNKLDPRRMHSAMKALLEIILMLVGAGAILKAIPGSMGSMFGLLGFSTAVLILCKALEKIQNYNMGAIYASVAELIPILLVMTGLATLGKWIKPTSMLGLIVFAFSLGVFVAALQIIFKYGPTFSDLIMNLGKLLVIIGVVLACAGIADTASSAGAKGTLSILAVALALLVITRALINLSKHTGPKLWESIGVLTIIMALFAGVLVASSAVPEKGAATIITLLGTIIGIMIMLEILSALNPDRLRQTAISLSLCMGALALVFFALKGAQTSGKDILAMLAMLAIIVVVFESIKQLAEGDSDPKKLLAAAGAMAIVIAALVLTLTALKNIDGRTIGKKKIQTLLVGIGLLVAIGAVLVGMTRFGGSWDQIIASAVGLSIALIAVSVAMKSIAAVKDMNIKKTGEMVLAIAGILLPICAALVVLSKWGGDPIRMVASASAMAIAVIALGGVMAVLALIPTVSGMAEKGLALSIAALALIPIAIALQQLAGISMSWDQMLPMVTAMGIVLAELAIVISYMSFLGLAAVGGALALDGVIIVIGALIYVAGLLGQLNGVQEAMQTGIKVLEMIGQGIGGFIGGIITGIGTAIISLLPSLSVAITAFVAGLTPITAMAKLFTKDVRDGVLIMLECIGAIVVAEFLTSLSNFLTLGTGLTQLGAKLQGMAVGIRAFYEELKDVNTYKLKQMGEGANELMTALTKFPTTGGFMSLINGNTIDFGKFSENMAMFGEAIVSFNEKVSNEKIDVTTFKNAAACGTALAEMASKLPKSGGVVQAFLGETMTMDEFADDMEHFATAIVNFGAIVNGNNAYKYTLKKGDIEAAADCGSMLSDLNNNLPATDGLLQQWVGQPETLENFGKGIVAFATALTQTAYILAYGAPTGSNGTHACKINVKDFEDLASAGKALADLQNNLGTYEGDWTKVFTNKQDLEEFSIGITAFAEAMKSMAEAADGLGTDTSMNMATLIDHGTSLSMIANSLPSIKDENGNKVMTLTSFAQQIKDLAEGFKKADEKLAEIEDPTAITTFIANAQSLRDLFIGLSGMDGDLVTTFISCLKDLGTVSLTTIAEQFANSEELVGPSLVTFVELVKTTIEPLKTDLPNIIYLAIASMIARFNVWRPIFVASARNYVNAGANGARSAASAFFAIGQYCGQGLVDGLMSMVGAVEAAGAALASAAALACQVTVEVHSPSRKFYWIGENCGFGMINALIDAAPAVELAAERMANGAIEGSTSQLSKLSSIVVDDMDITPIITPQLDLSNITAGAKRISSLLGNQSITAESDQNGTGSATYNFTQNNYSPKALSRSEIYRQTKNQFSQLKGAQG